MLKKKKNTNNLSKVDADFFEDDFDFEEENKAPSKKNKKNENIRRKNFEGWQRFRRKYSQS